MLYQKIYFVSLIMLVASMSSMAQVKFGIETGMTASRIVSGQRITESAASSAGVPDWPGCRFHF